MSFSIVIFTHNRPRLLLRALAHYEKWHHPVIVCDSSDEPMHALLEGKSGIEYQYFPGIRPAQKILASLRSVTTPYVCLGTDDDFLIQSSVVRGVEFLDRNADYVSVQGQYAAFGSDGRRVMFRNTYSINIDRVVNHDEPAKRIADAFDKLMIHIYALHRTEALVAAVEVAAELKHQIQLELNAILIPLIFGKHMSLKELWVIRDSTRYTEYTHDTDPNVGLAPNFATYAQTEQFKRHRELFVSRLKQATNADTREAERIFGTAWKLFFRNLHGGYRQRFERALRRGIPVPIKNLLRHYVASHAKRRVCTWPTRTEWNQQWQDVASEVAAIEKIIQEHPWQPLELLPDLSMLGVQAEQDAMCR